MLVLRSDETAGAIAERDQVENTTPMLLRLTAVGRLDVDEFVSHHFKLDDMLAAYDTFGGAAETKAPKVIIER